MGAVRGEASGRRAGVLITRPEPGCQETAAAVAALGWQPVLAPALTLRPRPVPPEILGQVQAVILASRAAARSFAGGGSGAAQARLVLAVGPGTAAEARQAGFPLVLEAGGDAMGLAVLAAARLDPRHGPLLLAVGQGYGAELAAALRGQGFTVRRRVAYEAVQAGELPEPARLAIGAGRIRAALFLSPRSAIITQTLLRRAGLSENLRDIQALALSQRIATTLADMPWQGIRATAKPHYPALLALLGLARGPDSEGQGVQR